MIVEAGIDDANYRGIRRRWCGKWQFVDGERRRITLAEIGQRRQIE
jgi:hypothetical protein